MQSCTVLGPSYVKSFLRNTIGLMFTFGAIVSPNHMFLIFLTKYLLTKIPIAPDVFADISQNAPTYSGFTPLT